MKYPVLDGHCDTAVELWRKGESLAKNSGQISLAQAEEFVRSIPDGYDP